MHYFQAIVLDLDKYIFPWQMFGLRLESSCIWVNMVK